MTSAEATAAKLLVIDDSVTVRMSLRDLFVEQGYEVRLAEGDEEGLGILRSEHIDTVILDLIMPGKSGVDTLREIKADNNLTSIPIILLTAVADRGAYCISGVNCGFTQVNAEGAHMSWPFTVNAAYVESKAKLYFRDHGFAAGDKFYYDGFLG